MHARASPERRLLRAGAAAFAVVDDRRVLYEASFEYTPLMAVRGASPPRGAAGSRCRFAQPPAILWRCLQSGNYSPSMSAGFRFGPAVAAVTHA